MNRDIENILSSFLGDRYISDYHWDFYNDSRDLIVYLAMHGYKIIPLIKNDQLELPL